VELFFELKFDSELGVPVLSILLGNAIFGSVGHLGQNWCLDLEASCTAIMAQAFCGITIFTFLYIFFYFIFILILQFFM